MCSNEGISHPNDSLCFKGWFESSTWSRTSFQEWIKTNCTSHQHSVPQDLLWRLPKVTHHEDHSFLQRHRGISLRRGLWGKRGRWNFNEFEWLWDFAFWNPFCFRLASPAWEMKPNFGDHKLVGQQYCQGRPHVVWTQFDRKCFEQHEVPVNGPSS